jgi:hypothetical protein
MGLDQLTFLPIGLLDDLVALQHMYVMFVIVALVASSPGFAACTLILLTLCSDLSYNLLTSLPEGFLSNLPNLHTVYVLVLFIVLLVCLVEWEEILILNCSSTSVQSVSVSSFCESELICARRIMANLLVELPKRIFSNCPELSTVFDWDRN